jgi:hypothetical protein
MGWAEVAAAGLKWRRIAVLVLRVAVAAAAD